MNKKIIIVEGYLASGKSTFALNLSKAIGVPYLIKDTFKSALCKNIEIANRSESSKFSAVTFDAMMYVVERLMESGCPIIIEGNFAPSGMKKTDEAGEIQRLIEMHEYQSLTYKFKGDTKVLHERFVERESTAERGQANKLGFEVKYEDFDRWCHILDPFDVGDEMVEVDTTKFSNVDFSELINVAKRFVNSL